MLRAKAGVSKRTKKKRKRKEKNRNDGAVPLCGDMMRVFNFCVGAHDSVVLDMTMEIAILGW